jgi:hypothetical protein
LGRRQFFVIDSTTVLVTLPLLASSVNVWVPFGVVPLVVTVRTDVPAADIGFALSVVLAPVIAMMPAHASVTLPVKPPRLRVVMLNTALPVASVATTSLSTSSQ